MMLIEEKNSHPDYDSNLGLQSRCDTQTGQSQNFLLVDP